MTFPTARVSVLLALSLLTGSVSSVLAQTNPSPAPVPPDAPPAPTPGPVRPPKPSPVPFPPLQPVPAPLPPAPPRPPRPPLVPAPVAPTPPAPAPVPPAPPPPDAAPSPRYEGAPVLPSEPSEPPLPAEDAPTQSPTFDDESTKAPTAPSANGALAPVSLPEPTVESAAPVPLELGSRLTQAATMELPEPALQITVVGTKLSQTAGSAHVINKKQLERFRYDDITQALLSAPGVYVRTEDGMGLRPNIGMRGVNPDRSKKITLMEDGVLFGPAPYSAPAGYYFPVFTRMTKVNVIKGAGAIQYGPQTVGGALDLETRAIPDDTSAGADVAMGQYGYGMAHVHAGANTGKIGFLIEGLRLQNDGFKHLTNGEGKQPDTGFTKDEWMVKANYVLHRDDLSNEFKVKLTYSGEVSNESYLGLSDADFRKDPNLRYAASQLDQMKNHRASIVLTHTLQKGKSLTLTTNAYRHDFQRTWRKVNQFAGAALFDVLTAPDSGSNPAYLAILHGQAASRGPSQSIMIGPNDRNFISEGVQSVLNWQRKSGVVSHRLVAGLRYHYDFIDRRHSQNGFLVDGNTLTPDGNATEVTAFNRDSTHAVALNAQYAFAFRTLTITPGLRTELIRSQSLDRLAKTDRKAFNVAVLPGVGAYYGLYKGLGLLGGVYEGFSPPPPGQVAKVKPEKSINYEAGARYTDRLVRFESVFFYNDYKNLTDICSEQCTAGNDQQFDGGAARTLGVEVLAEHEVPIRKYRLPISLAYTWTRSQFDSAFSSGDPIWGNVKKGDYVPYIPPHQVRGQVGVEHPRGGVNVAVTYIGQMRELPGRGPLSATMATDAQTIVDLAGQAKIWGPLSLYANIQNLFDSQYIVSRRPFGARPNAPRWAHVGIKAVY